MTATTTSKKFQRQAGAKVRSVAMALSVATLLALATAAEATTIYANGDNINLATGRSNVFSSSAGSFGVINGPVFLTYPEARYDTGTAAGPAYWQVNFPTAYKLSDVFVETHPATARMTSMNVQTTVDGVNWITQASPTVVSDAAGDRLIANFTPVSGVTGVRLVSTGSDTPVYPGIFRHIRLTGPNDGLPLYLNGKTEFSINSGIWNNGSVQSAPGWAPLNGSSAIAPIDDATTEPFYYGKMIYNSSDANPAPIDILLNDNYMVDTVAITTGRETGAGGRTATHVDVSYSSDITGGFTSLLTNVELLGDPAGHYILPLGGMYDVRRLRYDFSHPGSAAGNTFISELHAYAVEVPAPAPEPSSAVLLGAGLGLLAMKRRRQGKAARAAQA